MPLISSRGPQSKHAIRLNDLHADTDAGEVGWEEEGGGGREYCDADEEARHSAVLVGFGDEQLSSTPFSEVLEEKRTKSLRPGQSPLVLW